MNFSIHWMVKKIEDTDEEINDEKDDSEEGLIDKIRENPFIAATVILGMVVVVLLFNSFIGTGSVITGNVVSERDAGNSLENFLLVQTGGQGTLKQIENYNDYLYLAIITYQGRDIPLYITKDGNYLIQGLTELNFEEEEVQENQEVISPYTEEENLLIQEFSSCLYDKGMRVYYAGWCGHCHNLIDTFGGLKNAGEMMFECQTESRQTGKDADLCSKENITGFPTIKINGEQYSGARTFEAFAQTTGCTSPQV